MEKFIKGKSWRAKTPLHLVHSDLMGPLEHPSISGSKYVLTFIDDQRRRIWVYFLKNKDEVFGKFKKFKAFVEKQSGKSIKILSTDNGKEYVNKEFDHYCKYNGIKREHTVPYTPQQNGVAERKNRTLMEMARCMLGNMFVPYKYCAEAVHTSLYFLNQSLLEFKDKSRLARNKNNFIFFQLFATVILDQQHIKIFDA